jgi:hypothetical protein
MTGDIALRRAIQRLYEFDHVPTPDELIGLSDRWRPYRSLAVSYIFASEYAGDQPVRRRQPDPIVTERLAIVGLGGSLARGSRSLAALRIALDGAAEAGAPPRS